MRETRIPRSVDAMGWDLAGAIASLLLAAAAYIRSRGAGGFYDAQVYGMTPATHRSYAATALAFALAFFAAGLWWPSGSATIWIGAAFVLFAVFYLTSYLRGASEDDDD
jgi:peptidoglycan biosynthesis protein MviN/MurJ (putative lipid II flippase)